MFRALLEPRERVLFGTSGSCIQLGPAAREALYAGSPAALRFGRASACFKVRGLRSRARSWHLPRAHALGRHCLVLVLARARARARRRFAAIPRAARATTRKRCCRRNCRIGHGRSSARTSNRRTDPAPSRTLRRAVPPRSRAPQVRALRGTHAGLARAAWPHQIAAAWGGHGAGSWNSFVN